MRVYRFSKRKLVAVIMCGGLLSAIEPCLPKNYFFNLAGTSRDSLLSNLGILVSNALTEAVLGEVPQPPGNAPTP